MTVLAGQKSVVIFLENPVHTFQHGGPLPSRTDSFVGTPRILRAPAGKVVTLAEIAGVTGRVTAWNRACLGQFATARPPGASRPTLTPVVTLTQAGRPGWFRTVGHGAIWLDFYSRQAWATPAASSRCGPSSERRPGKAKLLGAAIVALTVAAGAAAWARAPINHTFFRRDALPEGGTRGAGLAQTLRVTFAVPTALMWTVAAVYRTHSENLHASTLAKCGEVLPHARRVRTR
jgi:hypothetical protein